MNYEIFFFDGILINEDNCYQPKVIIENRRNKKKKMKKIIYRYDYYDTLPNYSQHFSYEENEYKLDPEKHKLVVVGKKDLQELLNSYLDTTFNSLLQRFLQPSIPVNLCDSRRTNVDLIKLGEAIETANVYREKYNLTDSKFDNPHEVFKYLNELSKQVNLNVAENVKKINKKVGNENEKKINNEEIKKHIQENSK